MIAPSERVARMYTERGWRTVPIPPRSKRPVIEGWQNLRLDLADLAQHFTDGENIGVLLGPVSGGLTDADLDCAELRSTADYFVPPTRKRFGRESSRESHRLYICGDAVFRKYEDPRGKKGDEHKTIGEIRCSGQTVFPGSVHPSGESISWEPGAENQEPARVAFHDLESAFARACAAALLARYWPARESGKRHDTALALAGGLLRGGWSVADAERFVEAVVRTAGDHDPEDRIRAVGETAKNLDRGERATGSPRLGALIGEDIAKVLREWLGIRAVAHADIRPEIVVRDELASVVSEALAALVADPTCGIYQRSGLLVRIVRDPAMKIPGVIRPAGGPIIALVELPHLREQLDRAATWIKFVKDRETKGFKKVPALPPAWVPEVLAARREWPFLILEGIIETPTLRPDGSILDAPGYDPATCFLYDPGATTFPEIPAAPTREDAAHAALALLDPFQDFPFVDDGDRAVVLSGILSLLARPAITGPVPLHAFRSPTPGSGKGLAADAICIIATGRTAAKMTDPRDDDEARKRILALGLEGSPAVLLDNVEGTIGSPSIAAALTADSFKDRLLGENRTVTVALRGVWLATGNNITFRGDLGRRVLPCDLDPRCEHPEDRTGFVYPDLLAHVRQERPRLVAAALAILRAYHLAGRPPHGKPLKGSFESWDRLVRGAILWVGAGDPTAGCERIREEGDTDLDALRAGLDAWSDHLGPEPRTAADAIERAKRDHAPAELLAGLSALAGCDAARLDARRLGYALRRAKGRICAGRYFERAGEDRTTGVRWWVRSESA